MRPHVTVSEIMGEVLFIEKGKRNQVDQNRVARILASYGQDMPRNRDSWLISSTTPATTRS